ncbi:MAG: CD225/dispanin family protein [Actinobacteria bacterium]|nr:CD225/dispanin family protein [Actinomycetota bacterium]
MSEYGAPPPPPPYGAVPPGQPAGGPPPPNYLVWAILTIFCCWPLAIPAIVFAAQVNGKWAQGDVAGAQDSSRKAKQFAMWGTIIGVVGTILYFILVVGLGIAGSTTGS